MGEQSAILAGGCFWCTEAVFLQLAGVSKVESGYIGGSTDNPTYKEVCSGTTGHAEAIRITFDPEVIPFDDRGLERSLEQLAKRLNVAVHEHEVVLRGECECCARSRT